MKGSDLALIGAALGGIWLLSKQGTQETQTGGSPSIFSLGGGFDLSELTSLLSGQYGDISKVFQGLTERVTGLETGLGNMSILLQGGLGGLLGIQDVEKAISDWWQANKPTGGGETTTTTPANPATGLLGKVNNVLAEGSPLREHLAREFTISTGAYVAARGAPIAMGILEKAFPRLAESFVPKAVMGATGVGALAAVGWTLLDAFTTMYEFTSGTNVPLVGWRELFVPGTKENNQTPAQIAEKAAAVIEGNTLNPSPESPSFADYQGLPKQFMNKPLPQSYYTGRPPVTGKSKTPVGIKPSTHNWPD